MMFVRTLRARIRRNRQTVYRGSYCDACGWRRLPLSSGQMAGSQAEHTRMSRSGTRVASRTYRTTA